MKISIITITYNNAKTIEDTIKSVLDQNYLDIEYIIVNDGSNDETLDIVNKYKEKISQIFSGPNMGIPRAMNKGLELTTGDIIGILNADDFYISNDVIKTIVEEFVEKQVDCVWGDMLVVDKNDTNKIIRNWKSSPYADGQFQKGWHPPHPTFFVKKEAYDKYGLFRTDMSTAADYELMLRFLEKNKISSSYVPKLFVKMRAGGESNKSYYNHVRAIYYSYKAFKVNGLKISPFFMIRKPLYKISQWFKK
ncbi:MAG TPA: glycosyltransferase family 2 protein [Candidatus Paceibacterota bacterium]|mgnify:CR=1 FL=1|nr:glycosyltransferase family 2 protein [Candidatus Paceibacterota bacterium]